MGACGSKQSAGLGGETVVAATVDHSKLGASGSDNGDIKSSKPADSVISNPDPVMLLDCREFEVEREREGAVRALGLVDTPVDDPRFNAITKLMASIFQTPVALITLITEDRVWFKSKVGPFGACVTREGSWCNYISVPNTPEVLITEDASEDARFAGNPYVAGAPHIKFYAGAPLVGRNGMRYGTLCVVDLKRRAFSAEMYALLVNFAALVVQELERDAASMQEVAEEAAALAQGQQRIAATVAATQSATALVDVRSRAWPLLYANEAFGREQGGSGNPTSAGFWDQFDVEPEVQAGLDASLAAGRAARATLVSRATGWAVSVVLRPGSSDQLQPSKAVGIPNWVPSERDPAAGCHAGALPGAISKDGGAAFEGPAPDADAAPAPLLASCFWFATLEGTPVGSAASAASGASSAPGAPATPLASHEAAAAAGGGRAPKVQPARTFAAQPAPSALEGLQMGPLVGSGSFGRVYRGEWHGRVVAVKLVECAPGPATQAALAEAELSQALDHPCIVKTYDYALLEGAAGDGGATLWMVQQMCNHGTLIEACDRGWLRVARALTAPPDMPALLRTLREVAAGMAHLHSKDILHCDLTGNNVLLEAVDAAEDGRGFRARVCDFGLSRVVKGQVSTASFGTCSHMSPELMTDGTLTKAADVWSFGVVCWEMYSGVRAYVGLRMPHIVFLVTSGKGALRLPDGAPPGYAALMAACLDTDHTRRPSFEELIATIDGLLAKGEEAMVAPPLPPHHGGCKAGAELAAAAVAVGSAAPVGSAPPVGTPPQ